MLCPRHPKIEMTETGRHDNRGWPILHCAVCVETMHTKFEVLMAMPYRGHGNKRTKQTVLPPVVMPERWP